MPVPDEFYGPNHFVSVVDMEILLNTKIPADEEALGDEILFTRSAAQKIIAQYEADLLGVLRIIGATVDKTASPTAYLQCKNLVKHGAAAEFIRALHPSLTVDEYRILQRYIDHWTELRNRFLTTPNFLVDAVFSTVQGEDVSRANQIGGEVSNLRQPRKFGVQQVF